MCLGPASGWISTTTPPSRPMGCMSPAELLSRRPASGLACIAVTDHNTVEGALEAVALAEADPDSAPGHPRHRDVDGRRGGHRALRPGGHTARAAADRIHRPHQGAGRAGLSASSLRRAAPGRHLAQGAGAGGRAGRHDRGASTGARSGPRVGQRTPPRWPARHGKPAGRAATRTGAGGGAGLRGRRALSHPRRLWSTLVGRRGARLRDRACSLA